MFFIFHEFFFLNIKIERRKILLNFLYTFRGHGARNMNLLKNYLFVKREQNQD